MSIALHYRAHTLRYGILRVTLSLYLFHPVIFFFASAPPPPPSLSLSLTCTLHTHDTLKSIRFQRWLQIIQKKQLWLLSLSRTVKDGQNMSEICKNELFFIVGRKNFRKCVCVFGRFHLRRSFRTLCIHKEICKICIEWVCNEFMHRKLHGYSGGCSLVNLHYESRFVCVYRIVLSWLLPPHRNMNAGIELKHTASFPIKNGMNVFSNNSALFLLFFISIVIL